MKVSQLIFLTVIFIILSYIDTKFNLFLINFYLVSNITYLFLCYLCFRNPQKINSLMGAYFGFIIDLHQNIFFGLHATLFTLTILIINYNYYRLRMFSSLQITITFSFFAAFFVGFKSILLTTMNFQYLVIFLSFFSAFFTYLLIPHLGKYLIKSNQLQDMKNNHSHNDLREHSKNYMQQQSSDSRVNVNMGENFDPNALFGLTEIACL